MRKLLLMSLFCLVGCSLTKTETIYEEGTYIKGETLPYGFYYSDDPHCVITGYFSENYINEYIANGGLGMGTFFPLDSFRDGDQTYYMVQYDYNHSNQITLGHEPGYIVEDHSNSSKNVCTFKKLNLNE